MQSFSSRLIRWQLNHGRHDLPWQCSDPYRVWLSEIMLQQTQVASVKVYFQRFVEHFPTVQDLAAAQLDQVLSLWAGLGYYSRARNLHKAAQMVCEQFAGRFPEQASRLQELPGVGRSTAAAIAGFCFAERTPILDGNVKRVLARWAAIDGYPGEKAVENNMWLLAQSLLPATGQEMPAFTQGMMDLGAGICTPRRPQCQLCPLSDDCQARLAGRQGELPKPKPKKQIPERQTSMLLIFEQGRVLLQKRPPTGIWGGLWSLPEIEPEQALLELGLSLQQEAERAVLKHTFSHFRLLIRPRRMRVCGVLNRVNEASLRWFSPSEALQAGIPTPVRKLLLAEQG